MTNTVPKKRRVAEQTLHVLSRLAPLVRAVGRHDASLMRQLRRAAQSIYLNLNEGSGNRAGNQRLRWQSALGSTYETRAAIEIAIVWGYVPTPAARELRNELDQIAAQIYRLIHPRK